MYVSLSQVPVFTVCRFQYSQFTKGCFKIDSGININNHIMSAFVKVQSIQSEYAKNMKMVDN